MIQNYRNLDCRGKHKDVVLYFSNAPFKPMFKVEEFLSVLEKAFRETGFQGVTQALSNRGGVPSGQKEFFDTGVACEILEPMGKGWRKGKIKIKVTLEFSPDEPENLEQNGSHGSIESPLDDIRQLLTEEK